ncbi:MAG: Uma2 family endonuclease [Microcoleaceae cyanobacterium]
MITQTATRTYTPEEYLILEEQSETRNEYHDGEIVPMSGGTVNHNSIIVNLVAFLKFAFRGQNKSLFTSDVRLWIPESNRYTYPDVQIICGEVAYHENRKDTIINPTVIIEVLSQSTEAYDKGDKFKYYRSIPSFQEYIIINQYQCEVEQYVKTENNKWLVSYLESEEAVLSLNSVEFEISLRDIYEGVEFESVEIEENLESTED